MERKIQLNSGQQQVVQTLSGPLLVLAGAGTGKTRVVTFRVAKLIETGISPERILAVTFTNKAAREMKERVGKKLGNRYETKPVISTFHSYCVRILRRRIGLLGFPNLFSIYNTGDQEAAARQVLRDIKASKGNIKPSDFLRRISRWKSAGVRAEDALNHLEDDASDYVMAIAYRRYQELLKTLGAIDFDDILLLTEEIFHRFPETLRAESNLFDHLLVDEYQDTNLCQYRIIKALALPHRNICVVGDDDQSIYSWRGAEVTHILNFKKDWPDAKVIRLETNYRSTKQILDWANRVIAFNRERHPKKLRALSEGAPPLFQMFKDSEEEAARVVGHIAKRIKTAGRKPSDFAVLFRTNEQVRAFEMEFRRSKIPYNVVGSQSFFDRKEVKDIMAYLKTIGRPQDDISLLRIINTPARGIGATTIRKMTASAVTTKKSLWETMKDLSSQGIEPRSAKAIEMFRSFIQAWRGRLHQSFTVENLTEFVEKTEYRREIEHLYPDPGDQQARWNAVGEVISAAGAFLKENPKGTLIDFLCETSLGEPAFDSEKEKQLGSNRVMLLTYHAAKGLEFHEVYMVGMEEGILPHKRSVAGMDESSIAEERRLCYVGMTRAQKRLVLSMALGRMKWGKMRPSLPSRFVYEATGQSDNPHYQKVIEKAAENQ
ncbi:MAG: ATP-dependent helicase [Thermoguttaceae bacterium]|jgi:DNA helicase-2/ATP-dependent DNA helicase PcrA